MLLLLLKVSWTALTGKRMHACMHSLEQLPILFLSIFTLEGEPNNSSVFKFACMHVRQAA